MHERYSIEFNDNCVLIYGDLTIEEAFDFVNFYEKKGFSSLVPGEENSTICMMRIDVMDRKKKREKEDAVENDLMFEKMYEAEKTENIKLRDKIKHLEKLIEDLSGFTFFKDINPKA